jgi:hypothetical protein
VELGLRSKHLPLFGPEVRRPIAVEVDLRSEVHQLELVQPTGVNLDLET